MNSVVASGSKDMRPQTQIKPEEIQIVICTEKNAMYPQSLVLCEALRHFGGRYSNTKILAISPRPNLALDDESRKRLANLNVEYVVEDLNSTESPYGPINRIVALSWAEKHCSQPFLMALDSDTVFLREPTFPYADVGVRPVDMKGATSEGPDDPQDQYWQTVCDVAGESIDILPMIFTTVDRRRIRASYNGGFSLIRRELGIFQKTEKIFFNIFKRKIMPLPKIQSEINASTGKVGINASQYWGSSQAALSAAIWSTTNDIHSYGAEYNIPLNCIGADHTFWPYWSDFNPVLVHYHHLLNQDVAAVEIEKVLNKIACPSDKISWLLEKRALFAN